MASVGEIVGLDTVEAPGVFVHIRPGREQSLRLAGPVSEGWRHCRPPATPDPAGRTDSVDAAELVAHGPLERP